MKSKFVYPVIAFAVGIIVWFSFVSGLFVGLENFFEDLLFSQKPIRGDIVIVSIDNESIERIGQWPWPREVFARALTKMDAHPPRAVGLDVSFSEPSRAGEGDDAALVQALGQLAYPVVLPVEATQLLLENRKTPRAVSFLKPLSIFQSQEKVTLGSVNVISDRDGVVRKFPFKVSDRKEEETYQAFAYEVAVASKLPIPGEENLGNVERIVYAAPAGFIRKIPFWRILEDESEVDLEDKIVFLGATAADLHDSKPVPFGRGKEMSGVEIHANIANMLLSNYRLVPLGAILSFIWIIIAALLPALFFIFSKRELLPVIASIILGIFYVIVIIVLFQNGVAANLVHINAAWILSLSILFGYRFFVSDREKRDIRNLFSKYVSRDVLEEILRNPKAVSLGGEEREITVLFSDIRGFTTLSEKTTPQELVRILNTYFSAMTGEILKNNGVLDKYIGDAIMAFWGAPIANPNQADDALRASLGMVKRLAELNKEFREKGDPEINIGIGLYTGRAVVGNIGSELRFDYTVIGDTVNASARLEGLTKEFQVPIILGESTKNKLTESYELKSLGSVSVKGRKEQISIFTVLENSL